MRRRTIVVDLLTRMARTSERRAGEARRAESEAALRRRALDTPAPPVLSLDSRGFDLFAEIKRRSPSAGTLSRADAAAGTEGLIRQARAYLDARVSAISVLTEPEEFGGSLSDLAVVAGASPAPVMRKDFLVDPYQILEARVAGAAGVLLILRLVDDARLKELLDAAVEMKQFVLLEAFDRNDLVRAGELLQGRETHPGQVLTGLNCRDLRTLRVDISRFEQLRDAFPKGQIAVAESGLETPRDVASVARLGYSVALIGSVLMRAADPAEVAALMIEAGRREAERRCVSG
jgi:indole-3-glycerol phosphate synthase